MIASPDDTTLPGEDFIDTLAPAPPPEPRADAGLHANAPDRLVFFFGGFDPRGAPFLHRILRAGIARRNARFDETLALGPPERIGRWASAWTVLWRGAAVALGGRPALTRTRVHVMRWDDLVRRQWRRTPMRLLRDYWHVYADGLRRGVLRRLWREEPVAFRLLMRPVGVLAASLGLAIVGVGGGLLASGMTPASTAAAVGALVGAIAWRVAARRADFEWRLRLIGFLRDAAVGRLPALDARVDELALRLVEAVEARQRQPGALPLREIQVIGHGAGSVLATAVLARAMARLLETIAGRRAPDGASLSLVTLGQCVPWMSTWPAADRLREELALLAATSRLTWHDVASADDGWGFDAAPWPEPVAADVRRSTVSLVGESPGALSGRDVQLGYLRSPARRDDAHGFDFLECAFGPETVREHAESSKAPSDPRA